MIIFKAMNTKVEMIYSFKKKDKSSWKVNY